MASTVFDVKTWDQVGEKIWEAASSGDTNAAEVMTTWRLVTETLRSWQAEKEVQNVAAQAITAAELRSEPARSPEQCNLIDLGDDKEEGRGPPPQSPSPLTPSALALPAPDNASLRARAFDPREQWELVRREALKDGDPVGMAFPVQVRPNGPNEYNAFHCDLIKELRKTVTTYGLHAPFIQSLLENVMTGQLLVPYDCRQRRRLPRCQLRAAARPPRRRLLRFSGLSARPRTPGAAMFRLPLRPGPWPRGPPLCPSCEAGQSRAPPPLRDSRHGRKRRRRLPARRRPPPLLPTPPGPGPPPQPAGPSAGAAGRRRQLGQGWGWIP
ncbi:uncharacterized protein [Anser cygnoides]|uniref:uncharacterized protein n=1 Tax=Anser cygnoides TaxID=8845 RepID=UPI0034D222ED